MKHRNTVNFILSAALIATLASCTSEQREFEFKNLPQEVASIKKNGGIYKVGNPYTVLGQSYTPEEDYSYSETGMASWYGDDFHNKRTANGETYDMRAVTAAHRTLPLPSLVRVTNLENGKSIIARVNDRGPYVKNRIIDLSEKGAEMLGYKNKGTTKVKVEILANESKALKEAMLSDDNYSKTYTASMQTPARAQTYQFSQTQTPAAKYTAEISVAGNTTMPASAQSTSGTYFVQVGAFQDYAKAKQMAESMSRFGTVSIYEAYLSKAGIYRVRLGAYQNRADALKILDRLLDYGHSDVTIVEG